jgi:hypothetical protein
LGQGDGSVNPKKKAAPSPRNAFCVFTRTRPVDATVSGVAPSSYHHGGALMDIPKSGMCCTRCQLRDRKKAPENDGGKFLRARAGAPMVARWGVSP